jgi:hypothetical protein
MIEDDDLDFSQPTPPRPNFADGFQREQERIAAAEQHGLRGWWNELSKSDQADMRELFRHTPEYERCRVVVEHIQKRGRDPLILLHWARSQARKVGTP